MAGGRREGPQPPNQAMSYPTRASQTRRLQGPSFYRSSGRAVSRTGRVLLQPQPHRRGDVCMSNHSVRTRNDHEQRFVGFQIHRSDEGRASDTPATCWTLLTCVHDEVNARRRCGSVVVNTASPVPPIEHLIYISQGPHLRRRSHQIGRWRWRCNTQKLLASHQPT